VSPALAPARLRSEGIYVGRFAPSPTGPLHFGSLVAAVGSWVDARAAGGTWRVRMEDVDETRTVPGAAGQILDALQGFGLAWDGEVEWQSRRKPLYEAALERLRALGWVYRCRCSRREVADSGLRGPEGAIYPGTCRTLRLGPDVPGAERLRVAPGRIEFEDRLRGRLGHDLAAEIGDFILERRDGLFAYQLAVVVDDAAQGITDVVRGADLLWSTPRQVLLQHLLALPTPRYLHLPVATNAAGEKLSKQTLAPAIGKADAPALLRQALAFLGQAVPEGESPASILRQAVTNWRPEAIHRGVSFEHPSPPL
jgi:glutamyl-Q tRNA(Asp) synthetase